MDRVQTTGRFRQKKVSFTATSNRVLFDETLDMDTKTLHNMINYYISIPDFTLYKSHIQKQSGAGQRAFNSMWKQLKDNGYLMQYKLKGDKGTFYYEYELFDEPQRKQESQQEPEVQNVPTAENEELCPDAHNAHLDSAGVGDAVHGKGSCINKTIPNKILKNKTISKQQPKEKDEVVVVSCHAHLPEVDEELIEQYRSAFGRRPSQKAKESLVSYLTRFDRDVVLYALELSGSVGKELNYAQGVLRKWWENGVKTLDDVFDYDERYRATISKTSHMRMFVEDL